MKIIVQRVKAASCFVDNTIFSQIDTGYVLLVGFTHTDNYDTVQHLAKKVAKLRIFDDENKKLNRSILDIKGEILSISQFTIYGDTQKGNRPSFTKAMRPIPAKKLYDTFNNILRNKYNISVKTGAFGQHMEIDLVNDGPVTVTLKKE